MGWWAVIQGILTVLSVAQGIKSYRQAKKLEKEANQLLIQKYGTGGGIPVIYGTRRVAGTVVFAETVNNRELFVVYALATGEVEDISDIRIGGRSIFDKSVFDHALVRKSNYYGQTQQEINNILANQNPPNKPRMVFNCHMGEDDQVADPMLVGCVPGWTSNHRLRGITYIACNFDYDSGGGMFNGLPEITCTVQGKKLYDPTKDSTVTNGSGSHRQNNTSTYEHSDNSALVLLDYLTNPIYGKGIPYSAIDIQSFITAINKHTTTTNISHSATVESISANEDTVRLVKNSTNKAVFNKLKVGNKITITNGSTTYATGTIISKTTNTRFDDTERDYRDSNPTYIVDYDNLLIIHLSDGAVSTGLDFTETPVTITMTETGERFPFNGVIDTEKSIFENVKDINANMRGIFTYTNGQYALKIEDSESVTLSIDDDDILSSGITVNLESKDSIYNIVEVEFANAQKDYELDTVSFKHTSATPGEDYTYDDNGEELKLTIDMSFITSQAIAYQYARAILLRSRNNKEIAFQGTPRLLNAKVGELISVTNTELGMNAEQYRITEMTINSDLTVQVNAIIYQSNIYGYVTPPGETIDIPDDPVDSFRVDTPTNLNFVDKDPSTGVQPYLTWNNSSNYPAYEFRVVIKDSSSNVLYDGRTKNTHFDLSGIQVANGYTAEVQAINTNRVESEVATYNFNNSVPPVQTNDLGDSSVTDSKVADISADKIDTGVLNLGTESGMAVRQGKTGYTDTTTGFWLGNDSGTPKFHIGTSSNFLKFDGSALNIQGDLTATTGLIGGWTVDANSIFAGTKDVSGYTTTGITISSANNGSIHAKQFYIDSSGNANFKGSIFGGSIRADVTNPIPTDIFTRTNNQSIPTSNENGAFIDLSAGKFVFGDASKFISFNGSELDVKGVLAPTILDLTGTADTNLPSNIKATAVTDGSIGVGALKQAVWNEIDSRVGTGTGGFYVTATDNYLGEATKYITIATAPDHGTETVTLEVIINDSFGAPISFSYGNIATAIDVTLEFKKTTDSTWSTAGSTQRFYANPTPTNYITIYSIDETYSVDLTSGVGNDLENGTDYDFRVVVERADTTAQQSVFKAYPGGANDSNGTPIVLEAREGSVGAGQGDLFTAQYIYHSGDADTHIEFQEDIINIDAGSVNFATFESASQNTITLKEDVILQKNLTVLGTQTTLNTQILDVEDNNITLNYSSGDSSGSANGSGITIQDAVSSTEDATLTWNTTNDSFNFSHPVNVSGAISTTGGITSTHGVLILKQNVGKRPKIEFNENTDATAEAILEYNGTGTGDGNYVAFYSEVSGWTTIGNGLNFIPSNGRVGIGLTNPSEKLSVAGNISVTGTVDGRDIATDGTKLDGIEAGATTDQTQAEINALGITAIGLSGTPNITVGTISSGAITSTGLTVNGTASTTATFNTNVNGSQIRLNDGTSSTQPWDIGIKNDGSNDFLIYNLGAENLEFYNANKLRQKISLNGDISFYEDTGTTAKLFWDASAEQLNIGDQHISQGSISSGDSTTSGLIRSYQDDGAYVDLKGYGLEFNRANSYIRPTADGTMTLNIGGFGAELDWNSIKFKSVNGLYMTGTQFLTTDRNLVNIGTISSGAITSSSNIAISPGNKIQLSGSADQTHHIYHNSSTDYDTVNYSTGFKLEHYQNGTQFTMDGATGNTTFTGTISSGNITINTTSSANQLTLQAPTPSIEFIDSQATSRKAKISAENGNLLFEADTNTGEANTTITFKMDGANALAFDSSKNATFSNDVDVSGDLDVTGTVVSDGLEVDGTAQFSGNIAGEQGTSATFSEFNVGSNVAIGIEISNLTTTTAVQTSRILGSASTYRTFKVMVQATSGTSYHATEILLTHDGTTVYMTEYGTIFTGSSLATFDADISSGNVRLLVDPNQSASTTFKFSLSAIKV